jgi:hypothetical protein
MTAILYDTVRATRQRADMGHVTSTGSTSRAVSLGELRLAWEAVQSGRFRTPTPPDAGSAQWSPSETVIPILGAAGGVGATSLALALATISRASARVVECCSASASGLASASTAELGVTDCGWRRGLRDGRQHHQVLLERAAHRIRSADAVPLPTSPNRPVATTFLDCGWELDHLLAGGWLATSIVHAPALVVATTATIPGLRRLEIALDTLRATRPAEGSERRRAITAAVLGEPRRGWGRSIEPSLGPATRALDAAGDLIEIPIDRHLALNGIDPRPLPQSLLGASKRLLERLPSL